MNKNFNIIIMIKYKPIKSFKLLSQNVCRSRTPMDKNPAATQKVSQNNQPGA
jgi:hypothetical protein